MRDPWNEAEREFVLETLKAGCEILSGRLEWLALICWNYV